MKEKMVTTVHLSSSETNAARSLAFRLGLSYKTGPMAGKMGNPRALLALIAEAYTRNPDKVVAVFEGLKGD